MVRMKKFSKTGLAMVPVAVLASALYSWQAGLPDVTYPFNWIWGAIYLVLESFFFFMIFHGVFSLVWQKGNPKILDSVKVTFATLVLLLVFGFLVESR